jgi:flagellar motor component MotA
MNLVAFWLYTIIAGTVFAYALLWTIAQWLKADREVEELEREIVAPGVQERSAVATVS